MDFFEDLFEDVFEKKKHKKHKGHYDHYSSQNHDYHPNTNKDSYVEKNSCHKCSAQVQPGAKFCSNCGSAVNNMMYCSSCGVKLAPGAKFCSECGTKAK